MFKMTVDTSELDDLLNINKLMEEAAVKASEEFARDLFAYITSLANDKLNTTKEKYIKALGNGPEKVEDGWIISLDSSMIWREEGKPAQNIGKKILESPNAKTSKRTGEKYQNVPIGDGQSSAPAVKIKVNLLSPNKKVELLGNRPQGPNKQVSGAKGLSSGQRQAGTQKTSNFRTVTETNVAQGMWQQEAVDAANIFEDAFTWALEQLDDKILPKIIEEIDRK